MNDEELREIKKIANYEQMSPEELKEWRKSLGMTQPQVAKLLGISTQCYGNYERGYREFRNAVLIPKVVKFACEWVRFVLKPLQGK